MENKTAAYFSKLAVQQGIVSQANEEELERIMLLYMEELNKRPSYFKIPLELAIKDITNLINEITELQTEANELRAERDNYMQQALANQQLHEGMVRYYEKTREILKKYYSKYNDLRREMNGIKPPKTE